MKNGRLLLLAASWLLAISLGAAAMIKYEYTPGAGAKTLGHWPEQSKIARASDRPTLVMFAHPDCPCTRASIGELAVLMTRCKQLDAHVLFLQPEGSDDAWLHTDSWRSAKDIPGVNVEADHDGLEMRNFGITTSGHVLLYDVTGKLLYSGGITFSRGHYGDNKGLSTIMALLNHKITSAPAEPVFGCSLITPERAGNVGVSAWTR